VRRTGTRLQPGNARCGASLPEGRSKKSMDDRQLGAPSVGDVGDALEGKSGRCLCPPVAPAPRANMVSTSHVIPACVRGAKPNNRRRGAPAEPRSAPSLPLAPANLSPLERRRSSRWSSIRPLVSGRPASALLRYRGFVGFMVEKSSLRPAAGLNAPASPPLGRVLRVSAVARNGAPRPRDRRPRNRCSSVPHLWQKKNSGAQILAVAMSNR
jgi:hypothetical protein